MKYLTDFSEFWKNCHPEFLKFHLLIEEACNLPFIKADADGLHVEDDKKSICVINIHNRSLLQKLSEVTRSNVNDEVFMRSVVNLILGKKYVDNA